MHQEAFGLNCSRTSLALGSTLVVVVEMSLSNWLVAASEDVRKTTLKSPS